jgi:tetratricopeptide (TPR) repeat protein
MHDLRAAHAALKREDFGAAWRLANSHLNVEAESPEAHYLVGACLRASGNLGLALTVLSKALAKERAQPNLWMVYAATLHDLNRWEDAEKAFSLVHEMLPSDPMPPANIGATYVQRGKWRDAINWCDKALKLDPENHIARISKGFACLSLGRWEDAFKYSEALYGNHLQIRVYNPPEKEEPRWDGSKGKTVVVQCDQGVGDIIMFAQLIPRMQKDCKQVIVECAERLAGIFRRSFPGVIVYGTLKDQTLEWPKQYEIDASIHISHLGKMYLKTDADFERKPYITPDTRHASKWLSWLEQFPKPWVGIAWKGGLQQTQTHLRSVELKDYAPILKQGGTLFDLSYHDSASEVAAWNLENEAQVIVPRIDAKNYDDTIAFVSCMDKVVTVTTSVAHVCGALGKKAHVLVPEVAQWRYAYHFNGGTEMLWYSPESLRLYRQKPGETGWAPAIKRLACDL